MISGAIVGDRELIQKMERLGPVQHRALVNVITRLSTELSALVKTGYLSGQALKRKTGRLSRSVNYKIAESSSSIVGSVGTNVEYGRYWELGFDRAVGAGARGGPRTLIGRARDRYFEKHPPGTRHYDARPFLKPALADMKSKIIADIEAALVKATKGGLK
jgi:HK97 gp10 family phage protein